MRTNGHSAFILHSFSERGLWCVLIPAFPNFHGQGSHSAFMISLSTWSSSVQLLSHVRLFAILWTAAHQASLSVTNSRSLLKLMAITLVIPSNHLTLCRPLLLLPSYFPSIWVFPKIESVLLTFSPPFS